MTSGSMQYGPVSWMLTYRRTGDVQQLADALSVLRLTAAAHDRRPRRSSMLPYSNLATAALLWFDATRDPEALAVAVAYGRKATTLPPVWPWQRAVVRHNLSMVLLKYCEYSGDIAALDEAIVAARSAAGATGPRRRRWMFASNLGDTLYARAQYGPVELLDEAIAVYRRAIARTVFRRRNRGMLHNGLALALLALAERRNDVGLMRDAVAAARTAAHALRSPRHVLWRIFQSNLALCLLELAQMTDDDALLDDAVAIQRAAIDAIGDDVDGLAHMLTNLGCALQAVYLARGGVDVLREAVAACRAAVACVPPKHHDRPTLEANLAGVLADLRDRTGDRAALLAAVDVMRSAVAATPEDHADRHTRLTRFAGLLIDSYGSTKDDDLLSEAFAAAASALDCWPEDDPFRYTALAVQARALFRKSLATGDPGMLDELCRLERRLVDEIPTGSASLALHLGNLADTMTRLYERDGDRGWLTDAAELLVRTRDVSASVSARCSSWRDLATVYGLLGEHEQALAAIEQAVELFPGALLQGSRRTDREFGLGRFTGLAAQAASCALAAGEPDRAVALLERTRGLLIAEAVQRQDILTVLRAADPELAAEFERTAARAAALGLAAPVYPVQVDGAASWRAANALAVEYARRSALVRSELDDVSTRVLAHPDVADRLWATTAMVPAGATVVFVVAHQRSGAAIVLTDGGAEHVPLPGLTEQIAADQNFRVRRALFDVNLASTIAAGRAAQDEIHAVLAWEWDVIAAPVLVALRHTSTPERDWPRVWWCPVGSLVGLPLHAAGRHGEPADRPSAVLDVVVSSYTSTVRALTYASRSAPKSTVDSDEVLIVSVPSPGLAASVPAARREAEELVELLPAATVLADDAATPGAVVAALPTHRVAHFACHALFDYNDPGSSRLVLADDPAPPLTVGAIAELGLRHAELAYLSACSTTESNVALDDEAVHITSAFQLAGYRHVIGTLWPVSDESSYRIAMRTYRTLITDGPRPLRCADAATALHHAVRQERATFGRRSPSLWIGHVHTGP